MSAEYGHTAWTHFTKGLFTQNPNYVKIDGTLITKATIISWHNFVNVMIAQLSWHDSELIKWSELKLRKKIHTISIKISQTLHDFREQYVVFQIDS